MAKSARKDTPIAGDNLSAEEQKFFDTGGESPVSQPAAPAPEPAEQTAPPAQPDPAALPAPDGAQPQAAQPAPEKTVPLRALTESREELKEWKTRFSELEKRTNLLLERGIQAQQPQAVPQQQPQQPQLPDPEKDPMGYMIALMKATGENVQAVDQRVRAQEQAQQSMVQVNRVQSMAMDAERQYAAEHPDYNDAAAFLQQARFNELGFLGFTPEERAQQIRTEAFTLAIRAQQLQKNPAEMIHEMAKLRGFAPKAPAPATPDPATAPGGAANLPENVTRLQTAQRGQNQAVSLSSVGGSAPQPMTSNRLLEMSETEFLEFAEKHQGQFRQLMGN